MAGELFATEIGATGLYTDRPAGSAIGVTLSWPAPSGSQVRRYTEAAVLALWLCGWMASWWWPVGQLADGKADPGLIGLLGMWAVGCGLGVWGLWTYFRPARAESVTLEAEILRYDPGRSPAGPPQRRWFGVNPAGPKPTRIARSDIRGFALERVGGQRRRYLGAALNGNRTTIPESKTTSNIVSATIRSGTNTDEEDGIASLESAERIRRQRSKFDRVSFRSRQNALTD